MSSGINAMAAVTWEDVLIKWFGHLTEQKKTNITKLLGCVGLVYFTILFRDDVNISNIRNNIFGFQCLCMG